MLSNVEYENVKKVLTGYLGNYASYLTPQEAEEFCNIYPVYCEYSMRIRVVGDIRAWYDIPATTKKTSLGSIKIEAENLVNKDGVWAVYFYPTSSPENYYLYESNWERV